MVKNLYPLEINTERSTNQIGCLRFASKQFKDLDATRHPCIVKMGDRVHGRFILLFSLLLHWDFHYKKLKGK